MRGIVRFGAPIVHDGVRYKDISDNYANQSAIIVKFQQNLVQYFDENLNSGNENGTNLIVMYFSQELIDNELSELVLGDTAYAAVSVVIVFFYLVFNLKSYFLASIGITLIGFSFGATALIYQGVLRVSFFSNLHMLVIFIVLGIAADDIYVIMDAWRQSACIEEYKGNYHMRMSYAFKRALKTMAVTSITRVGVFLANIFSPIMAIQSFGIYAAIIIPVNFFLILSIFPAAIIIYEQNFAKYVFCCCFCSKIKEEYKDRSDEMLSEMESAPEGS